LLGVGLDELVRRDDRRRARLRIAATTASLAIAAVMSVLAWSATVARNEALFQRNEAQDLTEFMLTDLRGRLDEVGRLDILETVGSRLMTSYDRQDLAALDADALGRRARVVQAPSPPELHLARARLPRPSPRHSSRARWS
jgi:hypothetical protein